MHRMWYHAWTLLLKLLLGIAASYNTATTQQIIPFLPGKARGLEHPRRMALKPEQSRLQGAGVKCETYTYLAMCLLGQSTIEDDIVASDMRCGGKQPREDGSINLR